MKSNSIFPESLVLNEPHRRKQLTQLFYEQHHARKDITTAKQDQLKLSFYKDQLTHNKVNIELGIDLGCRGGALTKSLQDCGNWVGVDIDRNAIQLANEQGIPCIEMDISTAIDLKSDSFDAVCLTEVLEHLPYPSVTIHEVWRILKKSESSVFIGSVPIDYNLKRRFSVMRGKRLTKDPTHLRSFSYNELKTLLGHYFETVEFKATRGMKTKYDFLSWNHFVRDIAWMAKSPKQDVSEWDITTIA